MSLVLPVEFDQRAIVALALLQRQPELRQAVWAEVVAFYQRHPEVERTEVGTAVLASIILAVWSEEAATAAATPNQQAA